MFRSSRLDPSAFGALSFAENQLDAGIAGLC